jgi:methionine-rich copper-binding protein CopC
LRVAVGILLVLVLARLPGSAAAHGVLLDSMPRAGETAAPGMSVLDLRFNARIESTLSKLRLTGPSGEDVPLRGGPPNPARPGQLSAALPPLASGLYSVYWQIFTTDGHLSHGRFSFQVTERSVTGSMPRGQAAQPGSVSGARRSGARAPRGAAMPQDEPAQQ